MRYSLSLFLVVFFLSSVFVGEGCALLLNCTDGTFHGECSVALPLYCDNGTLVNNCSCCGCPLGYDCQADEGCRIAAPAPVEAPYGAAVSFYVFLFFMLFVLFMIFYRNIIGALGGAMATTFFVALLPTALSLVTGHGSAMATGAILIGIFVGSAVAIHRIAKG